MSLQETISKSFSLRAQGKLSDYDLAVAHQRLAEELSKSLDEYYFKTAEGRRALQHALRASHYEQQVDSSCGNGFPGVDQVREVHRMRKAFGNPASRQSEFETPDVTKPSDEPRINDGHIPLPVFNRAVELLMQAKNCTRDAAISEIYRAEKRAKGGYTSLKPVRAKPRPEDERGEHDDDESESVADKVSRLVAKGMKFDEASSAVHRAERLRKFGF